MLPIPLPLSEAPAMPLKLLYITNRTDVALAAQDAGVDWIFVDLEQRGKAERQGHVDSVKSRHAMSDIRLLAPHMKDSRLLVRTDPVFEGTEAQVNEAIAAGAQVLMLPMFRTPDEVAFFIRCAGGRAAVVPLLETKEAFEDADRILSLPGIDAVHIGLNDLHLSYGMNFMFEPLANGMVDELADRARRRGIPFGFGGIARLGQGFLPPEMILAEHVRLGSSMVILSRSFLNVETEDLSTGLPSMFRQRVDELRRLETELASESTEFFRANRAAVIEKVDVIARQLAEKKKQR